MTDHTVRNHLPDSCVQVAPEFPQRGPLECGGRRFPAFSRSSKKGQEVRSEFWFVVGQFDDGFSECGIAHASPHWIHRAQTIKRLLDLLRRIVKPSVALKRNPCALGVGREIEDDGKRCTKDGQKMEERGSCLQRNPCGPGFRALSTQSGPWPYYQDCQGRILQPSPLTLSSTAAPLRPGQHHPFDDSS